MEDVQWLFRFPFRRPLIESRTGYNAASIPNSPLERWLLCHGFGSSIDHSAADGYVQRPTWDKPPSEVVEVVVSVSVLPDDRNLLGRGYVVAGSDNGRLCESEDLGEEFRGMSNVNLPHMGEPHDVILGRTQFIPDARREGAFFVKGLSISVDLKPPQSSDLRLHQRLHIRPQTEKDLAISG